jgi:formylglycine-generating enzyme required for sulfatase activity
MAAALSSVTISPESMVNTGFTLARKYPICTVCGLGRSVCSAALAAGASTHASKSSAHPMVESVHRQRGPRVVGSGMTLPLGGIYNISKLSRICALDQRTTFADHVCTRWKRKCEQIGLPGRNGMKLLLWLCMVVGTAMLAVSASAQQQPARMALVIGNASYPDATTPLSTTIGDVRTLAAELLRNEFTVDVKENVDRQEMEAAIDAFLGKIRSGTAGLFYFSGYGIQVERKSFLMPINAEVWKESDVRRAGVSIDTLLGEMNRRGAKVKIVIIDAARRNPFEQRFRATAAGLPAIDTPEGTLAMYSTAPGKLINDGSGANSVFISELIKELRVTDLTAEQVFTRVRIAVSRATNNEQVPSVSSSLIDEFRFGERVAAPDSDALGPSAAAPVAKPPDPCAAAPDHWRGAEATDSLAAAEDHLARFPNCGSAGLARARIEELKQKVAAVAPPVAPAPPPPPVQPAVGISPSDGATPLSIERERALKPKDVFKECDICPEMVVVPEGGFTMGSRPSEKGRSDNEGPQRVVKIAKPFAVGKFHVTVDQLAAFVTETGYDAGTKCYVFEAGSKMEEKPGLSWRNPGFAQTGAHPAVCLSWNDAKAYVAWLSRKTGKSYRALTEAEWEYAARAGSTTRYSFGDDEKELCRYVNGADQTAKSTIPDAKNWTIAPCTDGSAYTSPVGSLLPNAFALHDMHGNAYQWLEDCWHANYTGAPADGAARTSGDCSVRVVRGGAWWVPPSGLRSARRDWTRADNRHAYIGFRLGRTLNP